jgi:hypothetical protein
MGEGFILLAQKIIKYTSGRSAHYLLLNTSCCCMCWDETADKKTAVARALVKLTE